MRDARLVVRTAAGETLTRERRDFAFADRINALDTLDDVGEVTSLLRA